MQTPSYDNSYVAAIYHCFLVLMMLPFALLGRVFYRRISDGVAFAQGQPGKKIINPVNDTETGDEGEVDSMNANYLAQTHYII